jgi:hypothetical protein
MFAFLLARICRLTVRISHINTLKSLWIKLTDALKSNFIGITTLNVSGSLSAHHQEFLAVHRLWYILCSCDAFHPTSGSKRSSQLHKIYQSRCTAKNSWWWAERLPETFRVVILIKLDFSESVGFIHKESVTMHSHTNVKLSNQFSMAHFPLIFKVRQSKPHISN